MATKGSWRGKRLALLALILLSLQQQILAQGNDTASSNVTFIFMLSAPGGNLSHVELNTAGVAPAVDMALDLINESPGLLSSYYLTYGSMAVNSMCDERSSLREFFNEIRAPPSKVFLLGGGCSLATEFVGEISNFWEIITMSYASPSPRLDDKSLYPTLYRTVPSSLGIANVVLSLCNEYSWRDLVIVTQQLNEFSPVTAMISASSAINTTEYVFVGDVNAANIVPFTDESFNYRIFFLNMYPYHARQVLCAAYQSGRDAFYPRYVWIILGWYPQEWWKESVTGYDPSVTCTDSELRSMLNRSLVVSHYPSTDEDDGSLTDVELTQYQFYSEYRSRLQSGVLESYAAPFAYDAIWALALAINNSLPSLTYNLTEFDHKNIGRNITAAISQNLDSLSFIGITGQVSFNSNGTRRETDPRVLQYQFDNGQPNDNQPVLIARISNGSEWRYVDNQTEDTVWPVIVPFDGSPLTEIVGIFLAVSIFVYIIGGLAIVTGISFAIANFIFRKRKVIRLTSPNLNYLIIIGVNTITLSGLLYTFPTTDRTTLHVLCYIRAYTQVLGISLSFGTIAAKMWRVYFIFHNPTPKKRQAIKDWHLFLVVMILCAIDVAYMSVVLALDREYQPIVVPDNERRSRTNEYGIIINFQNLVCDSPRSNIWVAIIYFWKAIIQMAAVFFAFTTRKVKIKALNDTKAISLIIYISTALLVVTFICSFILEQYLNTDAAVFGIGFSVVSYIVLLILFIPKWRSLYKDPHGENIFVRDNSFTSALTANETEQYTRRIDELEKRLGKYEPVTPFVSRKRLMSQASGLDDNNPRLAAARLKEGRSLSYSPGVMDVTASLPVGRLASITPTSPRSPAPPVGSCDSGTQSQENSEDKHPTINGTNGMFPLKEIDEREAKGNDYKTESTRVLKFEDELERQSTSPV